MSNTWYKVEFPCNNCGNVNQDAIKNDASIDIQTEPRSLEPDVQFDSIIRNLEYSVEISKSDVEEWNIFK